MLKKILISLFISLVLFPGVAICTNLDWIFDCGYDDYYEEVDKLANSNISKEAINAELRKGLPKQHLGRNFECLYEIILYYGDDSIENLFKIRMLGYSEETIINDEYFEILETHEVPNEIIAKLMKFKGKSFKTFESYKNGLNGILTDDEFSYYWRYIVYAEKTDPLNYSADIYHLLISRKNKYKTEKEFSDQILKLKHAVSYTYFLDLHLKELNVLSQLNVMLLLLNDVFPTHATFGYHATSILEGIYKQHPKKYMSFINSIKDIPYDFKCILDDTCP